jgi:hypothetical protein
VVYGEEHVGEYVDKHDEWLAATRDWTFDELRSVLYEEASDSALMGGVLMLVAAWCRCGDHADLIQGFCLTTGFATTRRAGSSTCPRNSRKKKATADGLRTGAPCARDRTARCSLPSR